MCIRDRAMIFEIGDHSDLPPVPKGFPTCGDYFYPENGDTQQKVNEIDFNDHWPAINYNVTHDKNNEDNEVNSILSISHWWPLIANNSFESSHAIRYTGSSTVIFSTLFLFIVRLV